MILHANAALSRRQRERLVALVFAGATITAAALVSALADGMYTAQAAQQDQAGNTGTSSANTFTVDTTAPTATIGSGPSDPTTQTSASFTFTSSEPGASFACSLDGSGFTPCTSPQSYTGLAPASHTFRVKATDQAGNSGPAASASWTITSADTTPPVVSLTSPAAGSTISSATPTFAGAAGTALGDLGSVTVKVYAGSSASGTPVQTLAAPVVAGAYSATAASALADGTYTAQAQQSDQAGNTGLSTANTFTVNTSSGTPLCYHNPATYITPLASARASYDAPMGTTSSGNFLRDLQNNALPAYSWITPNQINNSHDGTIAQGDAWLQSWVTKIVASPCYQAGNTVLFITWDEDDYTTNEHIATFVVSPYTQAGTQSATTSTTTRSSGLRRTCSASARTSATPPRQRACAPRSVSSACRAEARAADYDRLRRLGKRMMSRIVSLPVRIIASRSMPKPRPPVGGIPYASAST